MEFYTNKNLMPSGKTFLNVKDSVLKWCFPVNKFFMKSITNNFVI